MLCDVAVDRLTVFGLFSGIGGLELGLDNAGHETIGVCEIWEPARAVLQDKFGDLELYGDVCGLPTLPPVDVVTAGFPCTDFSQVGRTAGISGAASGLVVEALRLVEGARPRWLLLENVVNLLHLRGGEGIRTITERLEELGYDWAYRVIDSRAFGIAQRRRRVFLLAAREDDPAAVLFPNDAGEPEPQRYRTDAFGFSWTEGNRGLGWAQDAVPTIKGGTATNVPSPPAVWLPGTPAGSAIVTPSIEAVEVLQGFTPGWSAAAPTRSRWKLVGNAVTMPIAEWIGNRLREPEDVFDSLVAEEFVPGQRWPIAACRRGNKTWCVEASEWPVMASYQHLRVVLDQHGCAPLSARATTGFRNRLQRSRLRYGQEFMDALNSHVNTYE